MFLRRFFHRQDGAAAVELALVAPILVGLLLASYGIWEHAGQRQNIRTALEPAADYYMNGGTDDVVGRQTILDSWSSKPTDGTATVTRVCKCGTLVVSCSSLCSTAPPAVYVSLIASSSDPDAPITDPIAEQRTIRVR